MQANARIIISANLLVKNTPSIPNMSEFAEFESSPIAPSKVPAGQMYLQKPGIGIS